MARSLGGVLFGIHPREVGARRRGFRHPHAGASAHLEEVGRAFVEGYNAVVEAGRRDSVQARLAGVPLVQRGFAFEGAAMAYALLDHLTPWRRTRWEEFLEGAGEPHAYMLHVGYGWALARLHRRPSAPPRVLDPRLGWLAFDGYGFHAGFFHAARHVDDRARAPLAGYALRAFDQGLGRSLWFVEGARAKGIARAAGAFPAERREDLWSGVGLAAAYAGGADFEELRALRFLAGTHGPAMAQGAAFGAEARERAGNPAPHTDQACSVLCGTRASEAAARTTLAGADLPSEGAASPREPPYEVWRQRVRETFADARTPECVR